MDSMSRASQCRPGVLPQKLAGFSMRTGLLFARILAFILFMNIILVRMVRPMVEVFLEKVMTTLSSTNPVFVPPAARPIIAEEVMKVAGTRWRDRDIAAGILNPRFDYLVGRARRGEIGTVKPGEVLFLQKLLILVGLSKDELCIR